MTASGGGTTHRRQLGIDLRALRNVAGLSTIGVSERVEDMSQAKVSRLERGVSVPKVRDVEALLRLYGAGEQRVQALLELARQAKKPDWWLPYRGALSTELRSFLGLEEAATGIREFASQFVPGLLQTEDYARAVLGIRVETRPEELAGRVAVRMQRQKLLTREDPPRLWAIVDEVVLSRPVGGRQVMRRQLEHLLELQELAHVTIQVIPFSAGAHIGMNGSILLLDFETEPPVLFLDSHIDVLSTAKPTEVRRFELMWEHLRAQTSGPDEGVELIREKARQL